VQQPQSVLVIGIDPRAIPGTDVDLVETALAGGQVRFAARDIDADLCLVGPDDKAEALITDQLTRKAYACVVVGGGIRKPEPMLEFFETVINLIRRNAPTAAIAFNTNGANSVEAAMRWLPPRQPQRDPA
jgi:hypothetical protein